AWLFVAIGIYFVVSWRYGQTLPMKTWHIRLRDHVGRAPDLLRCIARYVIAWIPVLLAAGAVWLLEEASGMRAVYLLAVFAPLATFVWSWFDAEGQFLHDRILGTRLVYTR